MPPQQPPVLPEQPQWQIHPDYVAVTFEGAQGVQQQYYYNRKTRKTQWHPPAPPTEQLPDAEALDERAPARRTLNDYGVVPVPEGSPTDAVTANTFVVDEAVVEAQPVKLPATDITFIPEKVRHLNDRDGEGTGLLSMCKKHGMPFEDADGLAIKRSKIHANVDAHFLELHKSEGTVPTASRCYSFKAQNVDRPRKEHKSAAERKARSSRLEAEGVPLKTGASKQRHLTTKEAVSLFGELGYYLDEFDSSLRCRCDDKQVRPKDGAHHRRHFKSAKKHLLYVSKKKNAQVRQTVLSATADGTGGVNVDLVGMRKSSLDADPNTRAHRLRTTRMAIGAGVPLNKLGVMRGYLQEISNLSLTDVNALKREYVPKILAMEKDLQCQELAGKVVSIIADATPRQGDLFALIARHVEVSEDGKATVMQTLIDVSFAAASMDNSHVISAITAGLHSVRLKVEDCVAFSADGCAANVLAHERMQTVNGIVIMLCLCISHCADNAGSQAEYLVLHRFWQLLQKAFSNSDMAQSLWQQTTGKSWKSFSSTRWYSMYEVFEVLAVYFPDLTTVVTKMVAQGISAASAPKLLVMLTDPRTAWIIRVQLSALVEGLYEMRNLAYGMEGDGAEVATGGARLRRLHALCPPGAVPPMPSTTALIKQALVWHGASAAGVTHQLAQQNLAAAQAAPRVALTLAQVRAQAGGARQLAPRPDRPRRGAAIQGVAAAARAHETASQKKAREAREDAEVAAKQAELDEARQTRIDDAVAEEARAQALASPGTDQAWRDFIDPPVKKVWQYFWDRCGPGGDRHEMVHSCLRPACSTPQRLGT